MLCEKCGHTNPDEMKYCGNCGKLLLVSQGKKEDVNAMALAGFILGLASWLINYWGVVGILAIIFSAIGLSKSKYGNKEYRATAIVGLISGICNFLYFSYILIKTLYPFYLY